MAHFNEYLDLLELSPLVYHFLHNGKKQLYKNLDLLPHIFSVYIKKQKTSSILVISDRRSSLFLFSYDFL